jgi:triacylglycerol esterase/lipase EstA (alpha/beta hydrolase family)
VTEQAAASRAPLQDFPVTEEPAGRIVGRELLALAAASLLYPFGLRRSVKRTPRQAQQRTVVLVHGYLANRGPLLPLAAYLRARGHKQILAYEYRGGAGIEQAAIGLRDFLRERVRGGRINLVCHSLGGLVARVYLQQLGGARRVDRCITLGTPHRGTYNAYWVASRVGRELRPDSPFLARLDASRAGSGGVRFTSIVAGSDNIVIPRVFSSNETVVHVPGLGHLGLLFSPTAFRAVAEQLAG